MDEELEGFEEEMDEELSFDYYLYTPEAWITPGGMQGFTYYIHWSNETGGYKKPPD